jgi:hypothetical protein
MGIGKKTGNKDTHNSSIDKGFMWLQFACQSCFSGVDRRHKRWGIYRDLAGWLGAFYTWQVTAKNTFFIGIFSLAPELIF